MLEGKAYVKDTDMPLKMQVHAMDSASQALDLYDVVECTAIASCIKKEFDRMYGGGWQCVVGSNFSSFFTHTKDLSSISHWRHSISSSLKVLLID